MPLNLNLYLETEASWRAIAETILKRAWSPAEEEGWPQTQQWNEIRLCVGDRRPTERSSVLTDLGLDHNVLATFIFDKWASTWDQTGSMLLAARRVQQKHDGRGALLFEHDDLILVWRDGRLIVNERSGFKDHAVELFGPAADVEPIDW